VYCRRHANLFSSLVAASWIVEVRASIRGTHTPERRAVQLVSANYFADLGINLLLGRGFLPVEDRSAGASAVAVLSYPFWRRAFHNDPGMLGRVIELNGAALTVVGITPQEFTGTSVDPQVPDVWAPLSLQAQLVAGQDWLHKPTERIFQIFAHLKPSVPVRSAQAEADLLVRQYAETYTEEDRTKAVTLQHTTYFPNTDDPRFQALVAGLLLIVGLVLFVACANVGNMLLARGAMRQREISTRLALGAGRRRVIRHLLAESLLLSCLGGTAALALSIWATKLLGTALEHDAGGR
jgi:ABC-type antimicrobial peptide transport system permease subunit